jgi:hypothetical protein
MNKNRVERHGMPDKLAKDSEVQKGSKQSHVNAARVRGKRPYLIRGGLPRKGQKSAEAVVVGGYARGARDNDHPGRIVKAIYRAKGRTDKKLNRKAQESHSSRHLGGKKPERP